MTATPTGQQFENAWLSWYPRPMRCIFDPGSEFKADFQRVLHRHNIHVSPMTVKNSTANAICEWLHQMVVNALHPLIYVHPPQKSKDAAFIIDTHCKLQHTLFEQLSIIH